MVCRRTARYMGQPHSPLTAYLTHGRCIRSGDRLRTACPSSDSVPKRSDAPDASRSPHVCYLIRTGSPTKKYRTQCQHSMLQTVPLWAMVGPLSEEFRHEPFLNEQQRHRASARPLARWHRLYLPLHRRRRAVPQYCASVSLVIIRCRPGTAAAPSVRHHPPRDRTPRPHAALRCHRRRHPPHRRERRAACRPRLHRLPARRRRQARRPVTFVFNGGPGFASAWLDVGAVGPWRIPLGGEAAGPSASPRTDAERRDLARLHRPRVHRSRRHRLFPRCSPATRRAGRLLVGHWRHRVPGRGDPPLARPVDRDVSPKYMLGESYGGFRVPRLVRELAANHGTGFGAWC